MVYSGAGVLTVLVGSGVLVGGVTGVLVGATVGTGALVDGRVTVEPGVLVGPSVPVGGSVGSVESDVHDTTTTITRMSTPTKAVHPLAVLMNSMNEKLRNGARLELALRCLFGREWAT